MKLRIDASKTLENMVVLRFWSDSDFATDKGDRKSVSGGVVTMDGAIIQWVCKYQRYVSLSTMEAEFTSAAHVGLELLGLRDLVREVGFKVEEHMCMVMDNQATIRRLESEESMASANHVDIRVKLFRDYAIKRICKPHYVESRLMEADILTKALLTPIVTEHCDLVKIR